MFELPWYVFALLGAFFISVASVLEKKVLLHAEPLHFSGSTILVSGILSIPFLYFVSWSSFTAYSIGLLYLISLLATISFVLVATSLKKMEAGEQSLILSVTPVVTAIFAYAFLGEALSANATIGMVLIVLGLLLLEYKTIRGLARPHHALSVKTIAILLTTASVVFYAMGGVLDRMVLSGGTVRALDFIVIAQVFMLMNFLVLNMFLKKGDHLLDGAFKKEPLKIVFFSVLIFLSRVSYAQAVTTTYVALVAILKRTGALFTVILGGAYLKESHVVLKLISGVIIILGVALVIL
jgi:drug/metabolite transporter (DMT)-like permease